MRDRQSGSGAQEASIEGNIISLEQGGGYVMYYNASTFKHMLFAFFGICKIFPCNEKQKFPR